MKTTLFLTTSFLIYTTEAYQLHLPEGLVRRRRSTDKPYNISQTEFTTKMKEYQKSTSGTNQQVGYETIPPAENQPQANGDVVLKFSSPHFKNAEDILLKMLINAKSVVKVHQTVGEKEVEIKSLTLKSSPLWVDLHLKITPDIVVKVSCGAGCQIQHPMVNVQHKIAQGARAADVERGHICPSKTDYNTPCCLTELFVRFQELEPQGLDHLFAPIHYDASYCGHYSCGNNKKNRYSFVRSIVTQKDSKKAATDCSPNKYRSLTVLTVHPDDDSQLVVSIWDQAVALSCGCL